MSATFGPGGAQFSFLPIKPQSVEEPNSLITFRALIESISDNSSGNWNGEQDMGRADQKMFYTNYDRNIVITFKTAALYRGEHVTWVEAINYLKELTKPIYKSNLGYNGVFCRMKVAQLLDVVGILKGVDVAINADTPWVDGLPLYTDVTISFTPLDFKKPNYKKGDSTFKKYGYGQGISS